MPIDFFKKQENPVQSQKSFRTKAGTELPLLDLSGKLYLAVKHRLVWFRETHPDWRIQTEIVAMNETFAVTKAMVLNDRGDLMAVAHKREESSVPDFVERAETGSIGRALAQLGFGTQYCDLEENPKGVDAPIEPSNQLKKKVAPPSQGHPGEFLIGLGRKYRGRRLKEIPKSELLSYVEWLENDALRKRVPVSQDVVFLRRAVDAYLSYDATNEPYNPESAFHDEQEAKSSTGGGK